MVAVLITGGAGFIGSRLAVSLCKSQHAVTVLDNLHPQVHGPAARSPEFPSGVRFIHASIEDREAVAAAITASDPVTVFHLAAETGTGQSYDEIHRYCAVNVEGTAILLEELRRRTRRLQRVVLAGSRAVYGEGAHRTNSGALIVPPPRHASSMRAGDFLPRDESGFPLTPVPTSEASPPAPGSVYASTKLMQEYLLQQCFSGTGVAPVILRFQNVYGPGQSLRNPYTGVLSIFCSQILARRELNIYEDGDIVRDFVFVDDVVEALALAAAAPDPGPDPINIGSGVASTIRETASLLLALLGAPADRYHISGEFRVGDVRHAVADITRASENLGWRPATNLATGLAALAVWARAELADGG